MANKPWLKKENDRFVNVMGAKIELKALSYGKARQAMSLATDINSHTKQVSLDSGLLSTLRTLYQIKDWDLTDDNDKKLPITLDTFDNILDEDFVNELIEKVDDEGAGLEEAEKKQ